MIEIEKFLGKKVRLPEDRNYETRQGLWAKLEDSEIVFGLSEPKLVLVGGLNDIDWLVAEEESVEQGDEVIFAITDKILYLDCPVSGLISLNKDIKQDLTQLVQDPYSKGWLFKVRPNNDANNEIQKFNTAQQYLETLKDSEGFRNPEGIKGGVSEICKAVYSGIRSQKI